MLAAAMAFGLSISAFAETATPEAVAVQSAEQSDSAATLSVTRQVSDDSYGEVESYETSAASEAIAEVSGGDTYATLQAAVEAANGSTVILLQDVAESIVVPGSSSSFNLDLNGHALKAENGKEYAIISNVQTAYIKDTSADKTGAVYGTVDFANTKDSINFIQGGNFHATTGPAIITAGGVTVSGGSFYGASNQPVLDTHEDSKTPGYTFMGGSEIRAGEDGKIFDGFDGLTEMNFILTNYCSSENTKFYGDLGISAARIQGGYFDRQVPENLLSEGYGQTQQENGLWKVARDTSKDAATVTGNGISESYATVSEAMWNATRHAAESSSTSYTVTLQRDVFENVLLGMDGVYANTPKIELDLNGHTLTAKSANAAALSVSGVDVFLRGNEGTINGRVETNSYLWMIHTTVNALEGQPAIANLSKNNDSLSIKGTSVINGAAGQAVIVSNGKTTVGDGATIVAGENGILFEKGEDAADGADCFNLDMTTLYGDLGDEATRKTIKFYIASNGTCSTKFDRAPADDVIPVGFKAVKSGSLYELKADANAAAAAVGSTQFKTLQAAIDYVAENGGTVMMIKNLSENITIPAGKTITIDLQRRALTGNVTNNGTLYLGMGRVKGNITLGDNAAMYVADYDFLLDATLPTGYSMTTSSQKVGDVNYYQIVKYNTKTHETVKNAVEKVNAYLASINSSYKLETLTKEQIDSLAGKAYGDDNNPIVTQHDAVKALGEAALSDYYNTRIGNDYRNAVDTLLNSDLYKVVNMKVETYKQEVKATVDTSKTEAPAVDKKVPEDKQPTKEQAVAKAEEIKAELTNDASTEVSNFKDNNLNNAVKVKDLPNVQQDSEIKLYVAVQLQDVQLGANVETDEKGNVTDVKLVGKTIVFDVTPMAEIDGGQAVKIENGQLNGKVAFCLPIPSDVTEKYARVSHSGDPDRYVEIKTDSEGKKYIEINDATQFSPYTVNFTNTLPTVNNNSTTPAATPAATPAPTQAPAQKNDGKDIYYTCTACGYHDWTATDEGYKCNHCGHIESVKQLAGYRNVKGVYEPKTGAAAAQKTAVKSAAIPQTSDEMPIAAITLVALAALLGFGVTAYRKFHN